jgi:hypothetical protein
MKLSALVLGLATATTAVHAAGLSVDVKSGSPTGGGSIVMHFGGAGKKPLLPNNGQLPPKQHLQVAAELAKEKEEAKAMHPKLPAKVPLPRATTTAAAAAAATTKTTTSTTTPPPPPTTTTAKATTATTARISGKDAGKIADPLVLPTVVPSDENALRWWEHSSEDSTGTRTGTSNEQPKPLLFDDGPTNMPVGPEASPPPQTGDTGRGQAVPAEPVVVGDVRRTHLSPTCFFVCFPPTPCFAHDPSEACASVHRLSDPPTTDCTC